MVVSFVNAGLLTLSQSIGVIMGANIGTTVTAWIISALGFKVSVSAFSLPLLAIGIVAAMLISGFTFTFCAIVGALGLMGMMIKNCIVLMDEINEQLAAGKEPVTALIDASASRLRPVMMASLTTILGMVPLLTDPMFDSMAVTIMGGLLFSTIATLLFMPVLYALFFKIKIK